MSAKRLTPRLLRLLLAATLPVTAVLATPANADEGGGAVTLLTTIPVPGTTPMRAFDISWIDQSTQRYYLADRSNAAVDVADAKNGTFVKQIKPTGAQAFAGVAFNANNTANNDKSGPNGVVSSGRWLFVTDFPSRVVNINLTSDQIVSDVKTGGVKNPAASGGASKP